MNVFDIFLALIILAFIVLFAMSMIAAYSNQQSIRRIYKMLEIMREHQDDDYRQIQRIKRMIGGRNYGKSK